MTAELSEKDLDLLLTKTKFSEDEILEWFQVFMRECPHGILKQQTVYKMFKGQFQIVKYISSVEYRVWETFGMYMHNMHA